MGKNKQAGLNVSSKSKGFRTWKSGKSWLTLSGVGLLALGVGFGIIKVNAQSASPLLNDTTVHWDNNQPLYYEIDQNGVEHPKPKLTLGNGAPSWCLGLGVPLPNNTTQAQLDSTNAILNALSDEQIAILNNVAYLAQKDGSLLAYAQAQHATYLLLDEAGLSINQAKDLIVKPNSLLQDANAIKTGANNLINEAKKMRELPSFTGSTISLVQGVETTVTDSNGVLANFPNFKNNVAGLTESTSGNDLKLKADSSTKIGSILKAVQFQNVPQSASTLPYYVYSTDGDSTGKASQSVIASNDPSHANGFFNINIIGLGEIKVTKISENQKFVASTMAGAEYSVFYKDGTAVKWSDGQSGYPISVTSGTKANNTNVVLKVGTDASFALKNLTKDKEYYFVETKAPSGFALDPVKHSFKFDAQSAFNSATSNYHVDGSSKEKPTGSVTLKKVDADTKTITPQGEGNFKGVVYGAFYKDGTPIKWSDGINGQILPTAGTKADATNVALAIDPTTNELGFQNLDLSQKDEFYFQELKTSEGYALSTKKIPIVFDGKEHVDASTQDFSKASQAENKSLAFQLMWEKAQDVNGSLTGENGAEFELVPQNGTKGKAIKVTSNSGINSAGFTKNGLVTIDGKANQQAGNPNPDGVASGDYLLKQTFAPKGTQPINPISITTTSELNKDGSPKSYQVVLEDTVTHQEISKLNLEADKFTDNNMMFKLDLGILTDKAIEKPKAIIPTIKTKAHTKDGDQAIGFTEISQATPVYDQVDFTNVEKGDQMVALLHRIVTDKNGQVTDSKVIHTLNFTVDDATVKSQQTQVETTIDTTKDKNVPEGSTVTYVWTEELFNQGTNPKADQPEAKHDDLDNQAQTLTVKQTPTIQTKAHTKDGDQKIEKGELSKKTPVYDDVLFTNVEKGDQMVALLHRIVTDKDGKVTDSKIIHTLNFKVDDFTVKSQQTQVETTIDTTQDKDVSAGSTVTYVWTEELFDQGTNPKTDQPEAKHDDLKNKAQTLTVEKLTPNVTTPSSSKVTPKAVTPSVSKPTPKGSLPTTGSSTGDFLAYGGAVAILVALGTGAVYYMKKKPAKEE